MRPHRLPILCPFAITRGNKEKAGSWARVLNNPPRNTQSGRGRRLNQSNENERNTPEGHRILREGQRPTGGTQGFHQEQLPPEVWGRLAGWEGLSEKVEIPERPGKQRAIPSTPPQKTNKQTNKQV